MRILNAVSSSISEAVADAVDSVPTEMHPNLKLLSHSSTLLLHTCPRKYELVKLRGDHEEDDQHLAFGSCVGLGIQMMLTGSSLDDIIWTMFTTWSLSYDDESGIKNKKTFPYCIAALEKFLPACNALLKEYEILLVDGKPATELSFRVTLLNDFTYRGYVDVVLRHRITGTLVVLELKTTKFTKIHEAQFKNSGQALGYSLILDAVAKDSGTRSSYKVIYLVYKSISQEWEILPFNKSYLHRALWLKQLLIDCEIVEIYHASGVYPQHGESCYSFFRACQFFDLCGLSNTHMLPKTIPDKSETAGDYQFNFSLLEIINSQLEIQA